MTSGAWLLKGVDEATREQVREAAAREGISVAEYLTRALEAQSVPARTEAETSQYEPGFGGATASRHRLDALERRVTSAATSFNTALDSVDRTVAELAERFDAAEAFAHEAATGVAEVRDGLTVVSETIADRLAQIEGETDALRSAQLATTTEIAAKHADVHERIGALNEASNQMRNALVIEVARDLRAFETETRTLIDRGLAAAQDAAERAAHDAEAATARALAELRAHHNAIDERVNASEAANAARVEAARADFNAQCAVLAERQESGERRALTAQQELSARLAESTTQTRAETAEAAAELRLADKAINFRIDQITQAATDVRDTIDRQVAQIVADARTGEAALFQQITDTRTTLGGAIDETRRDFASADAAIQKDLEQAILASRSAANELRRDFGLQVEELRHGQYGANARLKLLDDAIGADPTQPTAPLSSRVAEIEAILADRTAQEAIAARLARIEEVVDRSDVESALSRFGHALHELADRPAAKLDDNLLARFDGFGARLSVQESIAEQAQLSRQEMEQGLDRISGRMTDALSGASHAIQALEMKFAELQASKTADRAALEAQQATLDGRIEALTNSIASLASQTQSELSGMAQALREDQARTLSTGVDTRVAEAERRQREMVAALSSELSRLSTVLETRLSAVEQFAEAASGKPASAHDLASIASMIEDRLGAVERRDDNVSEKLGAELSGMRQRIEDRFAQIESRSVRAIERLGETVALIGAKLNQRQENMVLELVERVAPGPAQGGRR